MRARNSGEARVSLPSTSTDPESGSIRPMKSFSDVVLPAPFEPSSPVIPVADLEADAVERADRAVRLRQVTRAEQRHARERIPEN